MECTNPGGGWNKLNQCAGIGWSGIALVEQRKCKTAIFRGRNKNQKIQKTQDWKCYNLCFPNLHPYSAVFPSIHTGLFRPKLFPWSNSPYTTFYPFPPHMFVEYLLFWSLFLLITLLQATQISHHITIALPLFFRFDLSWNILPKI